MAHGSGVGLLGEAPFSLPHIVLETCLMNNEAPGCPVCQGQSAWLDVVDFNKCCEEPKGVFLPLAGVPIYYAFCSQCGFCFAPAVMQWSLDDFAGRIYNDDYARIDPDYLEVRPQGNAQNLQAMFGGLPSFRHLDYGGGNGKMASALQQSGWRSVSYDPFVNRETALETLGQFELITAFEVFEHVPDVHQLMRALRSRLAPEGVLLFTTLLTDGNIRPNERLSWWYASPRNGHISLFSRNSLLRLAQAYGFNFGSFSAGFHVMFTTVPAWASHLIRKA